MNAHTMPGAPKSPVGSGCPDQIDHLVYAAPDLRICEDDIARRFGVRPQALGQHLGLGTRNSLVALGEACFLEIIGPDPEQPEPGIPRPFGIDDLDGARLVTWAVRSEGLDSVVDSASQAGLDLGGVLEASRNNPDGSVVSWRLTNPYADRAGGVVPFFIDRGEAPNPAGEQPSECSLLSLSARHPDADGVAAALAAIGVELTVEDGEVACLAATFATANGTVTLS